MMRQRVSGINDITTSRQLKRSRIEVDHLGFRLLDHGQQQYYLGVPAPPRAPEPYKIAASSLSMARAHRRSSFVILAEGGQNASRSVGGSPAHEHTTRSPISPNRMIHGRSSPFRPRGFKGPAPHAQSRPPSPPQPIQRRFIKPKSLSQGNSPRKKSSIPQPHRGLIENKIKDTKISDRDKWKRRSGKHVTTRIPRSSSLKVSIARRAVEPTTRGTTKPLVNAAIANSNETKVAIITDKKFNRSPTKIPIRHTPSGRFIQVMNVQTEKKEAKTPASKLPINSTPLSSIAVTDESPMIADVATTSSENNSKQSELIEDDPGLVDLLKQSSGGSGTSSVVNATTTTAVQPLRIDAVKILPQDAVKIIQSIKEENSTISRNDTPETNPEPNANQKIGKSPGQKKQQRIESNQTIEPFVAPMNVEAVIENVNNQNMIDTTEVKSKKDDKEEGKGEMVVETKAFPIEANEKFEKSQIDRSTTDTTSKKTSVDNHISNQPNISNESPSMKTQYKLENHGSVTSLKSSNGVSMGSVESIRSTDTGVSLNTVRGVSSAREKRGTHIVKRTQEIETLSGNVMNLENQHNGEPAFRWRSKIAPAGTTSCCRAERSCALLRKSTSNWCLWPSCCCCCCCCSNRHEPDRSRSIRAKHSLTSVAPPPLSEEQKSKIPDVLIEHNSVMRGAIPCLPVPLAWFCLIWNVLIPGSGTLWSGLFNLCIGQPRFSATASSKSRFGALIVNIIVGASQFFTVLFCLVGWGWSIWWGVTMIRLARKWKRFKAAETSNNDLEARGNEGILPAPAVPTQALRGMERAR